MLSNSVGIPQDLTPVWVNDPNSWDRIMDALPSIPSVLGGFIETIGISNMYAYFEFSRKLQGILTTALTHT